MNRIAVALVLLASLVAGPAAGSSADSVRYAWVQWGIEGRPHVRAVTAGGCPTLTVGTRAIPLHQRSGPVDGFADTVCDAPYPRDARDARIGDRRLPPIPAAPTHIVVFGDSGCRVQGKNLQACNDPDRWPMPKLVRAMAAERPQLVIHVGDYFYRETACPPTTPVDCRNTPFGDRRDSWTADWFDPAQPLFAVAPLVLVRGNHENCKRGGIGWSRYLSGLPGVICSLHEPPENVRFANLMLVDVDSAYGSEFDPNGAAFVADEQLADSRASVDGEETWLLTHKPPLAYLGAHRDDERNGTHLAALLSGHIHTFGAYSFAAAPPELIVGTGGDTLANEEDRIFLAPFGGVTDIRFGYAVFDRAGDGWNVTVKLADGSVAHRCRLAARKVTCD